MVSQAKQSENQAAKPTATNRSFFGGVGSLPFFQAKLNVNQPGDAHEREADAVADQVMRMKTGDAPIVQRMPLTPISAVQRACANCEKEKEGVQRKETGGGDASGKAAPSIVSNVLSSGGGQPMDGGTRQFMESRFGQDFSQVRIHTDSRAAESASAIQARAYTSGRDVVFGSGEYQPSSVSGQRLLAHELVHVGQQGNVENQSVQRWRIRGNNAVAEQGDILGDLSRQVTGYDDSWVCIKPLYMRTFENNQGSDTQKAHYERFVQPGDRFDISNLKAKTGISVNLHMFGNNNMDQRLAARLYPGSQVPANGVPVEIQNVAHEGATPIQNFNLMGHANGNSIYGAGSTPFIPASSNPAEPEPFYDFAAQGHFPQRCWFTRNANARLVGCASEAVGRDFASHYLRKGASVVATTANVRPRCNGQGFRHPTTGNCINYNGVEFATSHLARVGTVLEGPFWSVADFHAGRRWRRFRGSL